MNDNKTERSSVNPGKAVNMAGLRAVVAGYLLYLGISVLRGQMKGETTLSPLVGWGAGILFIVFALAFGWYTWRQWRAAQDAACLPAEEDDSGDPQI